jgi:hypothetical protein
VSGAVAVSATEPSRRPKRKASAATAMSSITGKRRKRRRQSKESPSSGRKSLPQETTSLLTINEPHEEIQKRKKTPKRNSFPKATVSDESVPLVSDPPRIVPAEESAVDQSPLIQEPTVVPIEEVEKETTLKDSEQRNSLSEGTVGEPYIDGTANESESHLASGLNPTFLFSVQKADEIKVNELVEEPTSSFRFDSTLIETPSTTPFGRETNFEPLIDKTPLSAAPVKKLSFETPIDGHRLNREEPLSSGAKKKKHREWEEIRGDTTETYKKVRVFREENSAHFYETSRELVDIGSFKRSLLLDRDIKKAHSSIHIHYKARWALGISDEKYLNHFDCDAEAREMFQLRHFRTTSYHFAHFAVDALVFAKFSLCLAYFQGNKYFGFGSTGFLFAAKYVQVWRLTTSGRGMIPESYSISSYWTKDEAEGGLAKFKEENPNYKAAEAVEVVMEFVVTHIWVKPQFQFREVTNLENEAVQLEYKFKLSKPVDYPVADIHELMELFKNHDVTVLIDDSLESSDPDHWKKHLSDLG